MPLSLSESIFKNLFGHWRHVCRPPSLGSKLAFWRTVCCRNCNSASTNNIIIRSQKGVISIMKGFKSHAECRIGVNMCKGRKKEQLYYRKGWHEDVNRFMTCGSENVCLGLYAVPCCYEGNNASAIFTKWKPNKKERGDWVR